MPEPDPEHLPPAEVIPTAKRLIAERPTVHWTVTAGLIGRIEREGLYRQEVAWHGGPYDTAQEWAEITLGVTRSAFYELRRLWTLMERDRSQPWGALSRAQALQVALVASLDSVGRWVRLAQEMPFAEFKRRIARLLDPGAEDFVRVSLWLPASTATLFEAALCTMLPRVVEAGVVPRDELARDPHYRPRCVETLARGAVQESVVPELARLLVAVYPVLLGAGHEALAHRVADTVESLAASLMVAVEPDPPPSLSESKRPSTPAVWSESVAARNPLYRSDQEREEPSP